MQEQGRNEQGFTLIELLVAIVVVGILTAVAIVGIGGLTDKGSKSACSTSLDAARAASAVHYANTGSYPTTFTAMTTATPPELVVQGGVSVSDTTMNNGTNWSFDIQGGGATQNTFVKTGGGTACT